MKTAKNIVLELNELLEVDHLNRERFDSLMKPFKEQYNPKIKLLDFKYYNEYRCRIAKKEKIKYVKSYDFETAAEFRILEKKCLTYIKIKKEYNIEKSKFYYDQDYLYYFYLGTAKNDKIVREYIKGIE